MSGSGPLAGRTAVVTGGTRGIGFEIAARLRDDGADVLITGTAPDGAGPEGTRYHGVDFTSESAVAAFADSLRKDAPDILINNAGISSRSHRVPRA